MSKRIQELAEEAGYFPDMFGIGHWDMPECKKFVALIVKECMEVCLAQRDPTTLNYKPSEQFAEAIKQHFGAK